jgi:hypothetical protein
VVVRKSRECGNTQAGQSILGIAPEPAEPVLSDGRRASIGNSALGGANNVSRCARKGRLLRSGARGNYSQQRCRDCEAKRRRHGNTMVADGRQIGEQPTARQTVPGSRILA